MTCSKQKKRQRLLTNLAEQLLLTATEKEKHVLETTDAAVSMYLSLEMKGTMDVLSKVMKSVFRIYDAYLRDFEELQNAGAGEELAESVEFLLGDPFYNFRCQSELENKSHDVFEPNDMDDLGNLANKLIKPDGHENGFFIFNFPRGEEAFTSLHKRRGL